MRYVKIQHMSNGSHLFIWRVLCFPILHSNEQCLYTVVKTMVIYILKQGIMLFQWLYIVWDEALCYFHGYIQFETRALFYFHGYIHFETGHYVISMIIYSLRPSIMLFPLLYTVWDQALCYFHGYIGLQFETRHYVISMVIYILKQGIMLFQWLYIVWDQALCYFHGYIQFETRHYVISMVI